MFARCTITYPTGSVMMLYCCIAALLYVLLYTFPFYLSWKFYSNILAIVRQTNCQYVEKKWFVQSFHCHKWFLNAYAQVIFHIFSVTIFPTPSVNLFIDKIDIVIAVLIWVLWWIFHTIARYIRTCKALILYSLIPSVF